MSGMRLKIRRGSQCNCDVPHRSVRKLDRDLVQIQPASRSPRLRKSWMDDVLTVTRLIPLRSTHASFESMV